MEVSMPTRIPAGRQYAARLSVWTVCLHALLAATIIGMIAVAVVWAYT